MCLMKLLPLVLLSVLADGHFFLGTCPEIQVLPNFEKNNFVGEWYEQARYRLNHLPETECWRYRFKINKAGLLKFRSIFIETASNKTLVIKGLLLPAEGQTAGQASFRKQYRNHTAPNTTDFNVLKTDYQTHAIIWSCLHLTAYGSADRQLLIPKNEQQLFILTRKRSASVALLEFLYTEVDSFGLGTEELVKTNQGKTCLKRIK